MADETVTPDDTPAEEAPAEETPAEETPVEETPAEETPAEEAPVEETPPEPTIAADHEALFERLQAELGESIVEAVSNHGNLVVRVRNDAWLRAGEIAKLKLDCDYLSFVSAIDWQPREMPPTEDPSAPSFPVQPDEVTYGVTGSEGRFQVFAVVLSTTRHHQIVFKTDVDEASPTVASWTSLYGGADWHERECWEMFGISFDGHPSLRHLYLPGEFEGHPLRKDYPLLAREVKPWPGLVDVEVMPAVADESPEGGDEE